ncbi:MFS transporter [Rhodococcus tukisamuensis]|uniref:Sugar phosphate permease n=1 Tax=Rhodococcus tukisamuensis TaxID=168276 RepID=A0A1G6T5C8_9NOCA|nr:MFS transporter [Rhodococcus tukisamuensis]SDD24268.1 Sugar phosphate permease [Rhodococcus tukisamuensis]
MTNLNTLRAHPIGLPESPRKITPVVTGKRAWGMTGLVVFLYTVNYADKAVLGIIAQPLARELGLSSSQIGLVGSLFFTTFAIGGFLAGPLNKYLTLRWALLALALIWSVVMLPLVFTATFAVLIAGRMALGLAEGPSTALIHTAAYSWHPPAKRGLVSAILSSSASVAKILFAPVLAYISIEYGWRVTLLAISAIGVVWAAFWLVGWKEGPFTTLTAADADTDSPTAFVAESSREPSVPWRRIFLSRTFIACTFLAMSLYALTTIVLTWLPSYFELGLGYSAMQAGSLFALPSLAALTTMIASGAVTDRLIQRHVSSRIARIGVACAGVLVCGEVLITLPLIDVPIATVIVLTIGYGAGMVAVPLLHSAVSELCPPQQTAGTMGMYMALMALGGLIAPYATGVVVDHADTPAAGYALAFQGSGVWVVVAGIVALLIANPDRDGMMIRRT